MADMSLPVGTRLRRDDGAQFKIHRYVDVGTQSYIILDRIIFGRVVPFLEWTITVQKFNAMREGKGGGRLDLVEKPTARHSSLLTRLLR